jgi:hypothetical protein
MNTRRWIMLAGAAMALIGTFVIADAAVARGLNAQAGPATAQVAAVEAPGMAHPGGPGHGRRGRWIDRSLIAVAADKLGLTRAQLIGEMQTGKSIAQVAQAKGVDPATIIDAFLAPRAERLNQLVENGRLTQDQADRILDGMRAAAEARINRVPAPGAGPSGRDF